MIWDVGASVCGAKSTINVFGMKGAAVGREAWFAAKPELMIGDARDIVYLEGVAMLASWWKGPLNVYRAAY